MNEQRYEEPMAARPQHSGRGCMAAAGAQPGPADVLLDAWLRASYRGVLAEPIPSALLDLLDI